MKCLHCANEHGNGIWCNACWRFLKRPEPTPAPAAPKLPGPIASTLAYAACIGTIRGLLGLPDEDIRPEHVERYTREIGAALRASKPAGGGEASDHG